MRDNYFENAKIACNCFNTPSHGTDAYLLMVEGGGNPTVVQNSYEKMVQERDRLARTTNKPVYVFKLAQVAEVSHPPVSVRNV